MERRDFLSLAALGGVVSRWLDVLTHFAPLYLIAGLLAVGLRLITGLEGARPTVTLGLAAEFGPQGVAVNALWPRTVIATDAINMIPGVDVGGCRTPEILADAAYFILTSDAKTTSGNFFIDDLLLAQHGVTDLDKYSVAPGTKSFIPDFFVD